MFNSERNASNKARISLIIWEYNPYIWLLSRANPEQFKVLSAYLNASSGKKSSKKEDCSIIEDVWMFSYAFRFMGTGEVDFNDGHIVQL